MNWPDVPDRALVESCLQGNKQAWCELLRRYQRRMAGVAANSLRRWTRPDPDDIANIVQNSLKKIVANNFRALREFQWPHEHALLGFLMKVTSNAASDHRREVLAPKRDQAKEVPLDQPGLVMPTQTNPFEKVDHKILLEELARCLEKLVRSEANSTRDIAMFLLYFGQRVAASDLARLYELSVKTVENSVARLARLARQNCL